MNTYVCESTDNGMEFTHAFDAEDDIEANVIAAKYGWEVKYALLDDESEMCFELELEPAVIH